MTPRVHKNSLGFLGESVARLYLEQKGYVFLAANVSEKFGEIDLIMRSLDKTLVFVEVKTFSSSDISGEDFNLLSPEDNLSFSKLAKLQKICSFYVNKYPKLIYEDVGWRIDGVCVLLPKNSLLENQSIHKLLQTAIIRQYENI